MSRSSSLAAPLASILIVLGISVLPGASPLAAQVTDQMILQDQTTPQNVVTVGLGPRGQRYSPLDQVNTGNVARLVPAWAFSFGGEKRRGQETQPLVYNGRMYVTGSYSRLWAIDAKTGTELWEYDYPLPEGIRPCCDFVNRGAGTSPSSSGPGG